MYGLSRPASPGLPGSALSRPGIASPAPGAPLGGLGGAADWAEHADPSSGKSFYYNSRTKETTWTKPAAMMSSPAPAPLAAAQPAAGGLLEGWTENVDPGTGKSFYFNKTTNESRWERPAAPAPAAAPAAAAGGGAVDLTGLKGEIETAIKTFQDQMVTACVQVCERRLAGGSSLPPDWEEHTDPSSQKKFYFNPKTQETRWEKPAPIPKPASPVMPTAAGLPRPLGMGMSSPGMPSAAPVMPKPVMPGMPAPASPLPPGWTENTDPGSGKKFYYNASTQVTQWDRPANAMVAPPMAARPASPFPPPGPSLGGFR